MHHLIKNIKINLWFINIIVGNYQISFKYVEQNYSIEIYKVS